MQISRGILLNNRYKAIYSWIMKQRHQQGRHRSVATVFSQSVALFDLQAGPEW